MTVNDIFAYTETFAPINTAADFDNCGILVGDENADVTKAVVALDITTDVVREASSLGAQLIISHHPVIFNPLKRVKKGTAVYDLIKNDITALCIHTNLDISPVFGVNTALAEALGIENGKFIEGTYAFIGELKESVSGEEFARLAKEKLNCYSVRYTDKDKIQKVCVSSGAGAEELFTAIENDCDAFLTGEMKHHLFIEAMEKKIAVVETGHFKSEDVVIAPLVKKLKKQFSEIEFVKSAAVIDNVKYL